MNIELKYIQETGLPSRKRNTGNYKSYTDEFIQWLENKRTNKLILKTMYREVEFRNRKPKWSANWYFYTAYCFGHTYGMYDGNVGHMESHTKEHPDHKIIWLEPEIEWDKN